jgi:CHAT domain-containing protein
MAQAVLEQGLAIARAIGERGLEGQALHNLAQIDLGTGALSRASARMEAAYSIARARGDPFEASKCLYGMASAAWQLGLYEQAMKDARGVFDISNQLGIVSGVSSAMHVMGMAHIKLGEEEKGIQMLEQAAALDKQYSATGEAATSFSVLASVYAAMKHARPEHYERGLQAGEEGLKLAQQTGSQTTMADAYEALGLIQFAMKHYAQSADSFERALATIKQTTAPLREARMQYHFALAIDELGRHDDALKALAAATSTYDQARGGVSDETARITFFDRYEVQTVYCVQIARLIKDGERTGDTRRNAESFHVSERRHARAMLDFLANLRARSTEAGEQTTHAPGEEINLGAPVTASEVQSEILDADTALLAYSLQNELGFLWVMTQNRCEVAVLPGAATIRDLVLRIRYLSRNPGFAGFPALARSLYEILIQPAQSWIAGKRRLLIVPDDALHLLPFQFLLMQPLTSRIHARDLPYLVHDYEIAYAPSASIFAHLHRRRASQPAPAHERDLIAFAPVNFNEQGWGALPKTEDEVQQIGALFPSDRMSLKIGVEATKAAVMGANLQAYRFVHFATHGMMDSQDPNNAALALSDDGGGRPMLHPYEIMRLKLASDLVTLSACETGLGPVTAEGVLSLMRAFFYAGTDAVCASLWPVDDAATADLMRRFYTHMIQDGRDTAAALRAAQLELIGGTAWASPAYWAAFVVSGGIVAGEQ